MKIQWNDETKSYDMLDISVRHMLDILLMAEFTIQLEDGRRESHVQRTAKLLKEEWFKPVPRCSDGCSFVAE